MSRLFNSHDGSSPQAFFSWSLKHHHAQDVLLPLCFIDGEGVNEPVVINLILTITEFKAEM